MRIFPDHWAHPDAELEVMSSPVGMICDECDNAIGPKDRGVEIPCLLPDHPPLTYFHRVCFLRRLGVGCIHCGNTH